MLIPAYEPGEHLVPLVRAMIELAPEAHILVVDDGSGPAYGERFRLATAAGAVVLRHEVNRGKGAALKTGIRAILERWPGEDVITADADGQHTPRDIAQVGAELVHSPAPHLILGARTFGGDVPRRSRFGNAVSRRLFQLAAGWRATDTQTGLRGIPSGMLPWLLEVPGERFEYEIAVLLRLHRAGYAAREIPIETVYLKQNESSHFRPIMDSARVLLPMLLFAGSSLLAFALDTVALLILHALTSSLVASIVGARVFSASVNFAINRRFVFRRQGRRRVTGQALRYAGLAVLLLASNTVWMNALTDLGLPLLLAKAITESVLFVTSYSAQQRFVFRRAGAPDSGALTPAVGRPEPRANPPVRALDASADHRG